MSKGLIENRLVDRQIAALTERIRGATELSVRSDHAKEPRSRVSSSPASSSVAARGNHNQRSNNLDRNGESPLSRKIRVLERELRVVDDGGEEEEGVARSGGGQPSSSKTLSSSARSLAKSASYAAAALAARDGGETRTKSAAAHQRRARRRPKSASVGATKSSGRASAASKRLVSAYS